jgi:Double zinc ribbon
MGALAVFGISNDGLNLAVKLLLLVLIAIWLALVFWTYADARRRIEDQMLVTCAAAASLFFPFVGAIVYTIVRPPEYLDDVRERELEIAAAEARLSLVEQATCPKCGAEIEKNFLRCPSCARKLKEPCASCGRPLDPRWRLCPYCEAEVPRREEAEGGTRRRAGRRAARTPERGERPARGSERGDRQAGAPTARARAGSERSGSDGSGSRDEQRAGSRSGAGSAEDPDRS